jgi:thiol-disulfide isomerase/thioredoxin
VKKALALLSLLLVALTGCGSSGMSKGAVVSANGQITQWPHAADRGTPVNLTLPSLDGKQISVADYRGKVLVINIWWSGCAPCIAEAPLLKQAYAAKTAEFVGIDIRDSSADQGLAFERAQGIPYPSIYSPDGSALLAFTAEISPQTIPATVVLDPQGRVAAIIRGAVPSAVTLEDVIQDAAKAAS